MTGRSNALRVPLLQYVLGMMLDETIQSANRFFSVLSRGRYALQHKQGKSGAGYGGLDIEVLDGMSGTCRSVETLSGGEQFLASLSLAFGLSDVVQSYSGAVRLDSTRSIPPCVRSRASAKAGASSVSSLTFRNCKAASRR